MKATMKSAKLGAAAPLTEYGAPSRYLVRVRLRLRLRVRVKVRVKG